MNTRCHIPIFASVYEDIFLSAVSMQITVHENLSLFLKPAWKVVEMPVHTQRMFFSKSKQNGKDLLCYLLQTKNTEYLISTNKA